MAAGTSAPHSVNGLKQAPVEGTSLAFTFDEKKGKVSTRHKTQCFEMMGAARGFINRPPLKT